jgi:L-ribulose-5-phosphate 3-epimerase
MNSKGFARREFLGTVAGGAAAVLMSADAREKPPLAQADLSPAVRVPLKIGHRASNMGMLGNFDVMRVARQIPGLMGVELQVSEGQPNLRDLDVVRRYKQVANRWGMMIPSVAGVWNPGVTFTSPEARSNLRQAIRAGELLGARGVLITALAKNCPDMSKEESFGPVIEVLTDVARDAADAGVVLAVEPCINPEDSRKLVDLIGHPSVRIYYDVYNAVLYGFGQEAIPGIRLLGKSRIYQVHVKNFDGMNERQTRLIEETGLLDWKAALEALNEIGYDGWFVFETGHPEHAQMLRDAARNIAFLEKHCQMPLA